MSNGTRISFLQSVQNNTNKILRVQLGLVLAVAVGMFFYAGQSAAEAAIYGGCIALMNTWIMGRRVRMAEQVSKQAPGQEALVLYVGAVQRFIFTAALFVLGMWWLKLLPMPLLAAFAFAQAGYLVGDGQRLKTPGTINN